MSQTSVPRRPRGALTIAAISTVSLVAMIGVGVAGVVMNRFARENQMQLIDNLITRNVYSTIDQLQLTSAKKELPEKLQTPDAPEAREWLDREVGAVHAEAFSQQSVAIIGPRGIVYAFEATGAPSFRDLPRLEQQTEIVVSALRSRSPHRLRERDQGYAFIDGKTDAGRSDHAPRWDVHLVNLDRTPAIVGAARIGSGDAPYILATTTLISPARIHQMGNTLMLKDLRAIDALAPTPAGYAEFVICADDGQPITKLVWSPGTPGNTLLFVVLPTMFGLVALLLGLFVTALRRMDVLNRQAAENSARAIYLANFDPLSGLANRRSFAEYLEQLVGRRPFQVAFIDADDFKGINDTLGHAAGDEVVRTIAHRLNMAFHAKHYLVARLGGDEFAVVDSAPELDADRLGQTLLAIADEKIAVDKKLLSIGLSVGIAESPKFGATVSELMRNADIALYAAKADGKGTFAIYSGALGQEVEERKTREELLARAVEAGQFELHYQPIVCLATDMPTSIEALVRLKGNHGITPDIFIPIVESMGLMPRLGEWIIRTAFEDSLKWSGVHTSINLSPLQIQAPDLLAIIDGYQVELDIDPHTIIFEITEGVLLDKTQHVGEVLDGLKARGYKLALDDFGTGYSSLSYLGDINIDRLKLDQSFVRGGRIREARNATLVRAVIDIGRNLGIEVVAEGVEEIAEIAALRKWGCSHVQGYLLSKAVPANAAVQRLRTLMDNSRSTEMPRNRARKLAVI